MNDWYPNVPGARGGSDTSLAAAESVAHDLARTQRMVRDVIAEAAVRGATGDEVAERLGWERWAVRPRTSELRALKRIVDSGLRRLNVATGRKAIVWCLPEYKAEAL